MLALRRDLICLGGWGLFCDCGAWVVREQVEFLPLRYTSESDMSRAVKALQDGGYVIVFRHGATHADQADTDPLNIANVAKQRQLNDQGRALAREIGEAID